MGEYRTKEGRPPAFQIAYISGNTQERLYAQQSFVDYSEDIAIAYEAGGIDSRTARRIAEANPRLIFYTTGTDSTPLKKVMSDIYLLRGYMPDTPILVRTEVEEESLMVQTLVEEGIHILDDRLEFHHAVEAIDKIRAGEHVVRYATEEQLERFRDWQEVFRSEKECGPVLLKEFVWPEFSQNGHSKERY